MCFTTYAVNRINIMCGHMSTLLLFNKSETIHPRRDDHSIDLEPFALLSLYTW